MSAPAEPEVVVHGNARELAGSVAERLVQKLVDLQADGGVPSLVLTGGTIANEIYREVLEMPGRDSVDWSRVDFWYGDERFVPAADSDRNALQSREAFLSALPVDPARVHEMPPSDGEYGEDVDAAARAYAEEVSGALGVDGRFDVLLLGVGPDGHCASLFPGHDEVHAGGLAVGVRNSPKPPPERISLTMEVLLRAQEVWFVVSGDGKAKAVHDALGGTDVHAVPAAGPRGHRRTLWLVDSDAASLLPRS
ncbi:MAG TPA: 6-phosphogluconolactonase [Nocardioidaceae bacterium]|nr:6-phosphogluconolactonase [Nocardioidaceae bacterium]